MKYDIPYDHIEEEYVIGGKSQWEFGKVRDCANKYRLELSDDDFYNFLTLYRKDIDIGWIMYRMSNFNESFLDSLVSYLTY
ncbi:hypothetical protein [Bacillus safensis]|uniref:hypothetical protein n=1 Tax=Bacillus safensis TaxID=561879 RepID=UPI001CF0C27D|nr:hypothetical protein [Bacillus safensis]MCA6607465.1 hypothetical protein [Bacillus safensis]